MLQPGDDVVEDQRHFAARDVRDGEAGPLVGHMLHLDAGEELEQLAGKMRHRAGPARGVVQLPGLRLGERDQATDVAQAESRGDDENVRGAADIHDGDEVLFGVVRHVLQRGPDRVRARGAHQQRVAVGGAFRYEFTADGAARAGLVVHHDGFRPQVAQLLRQHARQHVGRAAGGERHDDVHGALGVLRLGRHDYEQQQCS
jgi:hypothetical protein